MQIFSYTLKVVLVQLASTRWPYYALRIVSKYNKTNLGPERGNSSIGFENDLPKRVISSIGLKELIFK